MASSFGKPIYVGLDIAVNWQETRRKGEGGQEVQFSNWARCEVQKLGHQEEYLSSRRECSGLMLHIVHDSRHCEANAETAHMCICCRYTHRPQLITSHTTLEVSCNWSLPGNYIPK